MDPIHALLLKGCVVDSLQAFVKVNYHGVYCNLRDVESHPSFSHWVRSWVSVSP